MKLVIMFTVKHILGFEASVYLSLKKLLLLISTVIFVIIYLNILNFSCSTKNATFYKTTVINLFLSMALIQTDALIPSLPWTAFSRDTQIKLLKIIRRILNSRGTFLTYKYLHTFALPSQIRFRKILRKLFKEAHIPNTVWINVPPQAIIKCIK